MSGWLIGLLAVGTWAAPPTRPSTGEDAPVMNQAEDPYLWLEDVEGERALDWAREQNDQSTSRLTSSPRFAPLRDRFRAILDSDDRIPMVTRYGAYLYNFWQDADHPRGWLRRTSMASYRTPNPEWEAVLDLDRLAEEEGENWVWSGFRPLFPDYDLCLVQLSRGGGDARVVREFDLTRKQFVPDGFVLPEAKSRVDWRDRDRLFVATDFGPGSLTSSGYPRILKSWTRGSALDEAETVFEGREDDMSVDGDVVHDRGCTYTFVSRRVTFRTSEMSILINDSWTPIEKPDDAEIDTFGSWLLLTLRSDWTVQDRSYPAGALLAVPMDDYLAGKRDFHVLYEPSTERALVDVSGTLNYLILSEIEHVRTRLFSLRWTGTDWERQELPAPPLATVHVWGVDRHTSDDYWMLRSDFLTPSRLLLGRIGEGEPDTLKQLPAYFRSEGLVIEQHFTESKDGTRIPYFQVSPQGGEQAPPLRRTLLTGYGGFEIPLLSDYRAVTGSAWLEEGNILVVANIRGGGEYGPSWHQQALRENRQKAYDDFAAVAEDLMRRNITSPDRIAIRGGSNGGLLVGNLLVQRPELFGAVVCQVPLLDMKRYNHLLAGASWVDEYGDPDKPEDWAFLQRYSPYHQVRSDRAYPPTLFTTSTRDDRVHPGHARKMSARMTEQGHNILYYENIEGGHGGAANNEQRAFMEALVYAFLEQTLEQTSAP